MNQPSRIRYINGAGILLALFGFAFSPWLGSRSALEILVELAEFLRSSAPSADIARQQAIFAILGGVLLCLLFQTLAFGLKIRTGKDGFLLQEGIFAILGLALLVLLMFAYQADTVGLYVTGLSILVAALAALIDRIRNRLLPITPPESTDPMVEFQRRVAQSFHRSSAAKKPFSLGMIGLPDYQEMADVFGTETAGEIFAQLVRFLDEMASNSIFTAFSSGAVMIASPDTAKSSTQALLDQIAERMGSHGFPGEMLLPGGHIRLASHVASFPDDVDNLARLTEEVLSGYAEKSVHP